TGGGGGAGPRVAAVAGGRAAPPPLNCALALGATANVNKTRGAESCATLRSGSDIAAETATRAPHLQCAFGRQHASSPQGAPGRGRARPLDGKEVRRRCLSPSRDARPDDRGQTESARAPRVEGG